MLGGGWLLFHTWPVGVEKKKSSKTAFCVLFKELKKFKCDKYTEKNIQGDKYFFMALYKTLVQEKQMNIWWNLYLFVLQI